MLSEDFEDDPAVAVGSSSVTWQIEPRGTAETRNWLGTLSVDTAADSGAAADKPVVLPRNAIHSSVNLPGKGRRRLTSLPIFSQQTLVIRFARQGQETLGLRLVLQASEGGKRGAFVGTVDAHSIAWRAGLHAGDLITSIDVELSGVRAAISCGQEAYDVLAASCGRMALTVKRRRWTEADAAAVCLQSAWRGIHVRFTLDDLSRAAALVQLRWREHAYRRRRYWELAAINPSILGSHSILAAPRLSRHSSWYSSSHPPSGRDSSSSSGEHSGSGSSGASRRESHSFQE